MRHQSSLIPGSGIADPAGYSLKMNTWVSVVLKDTSQVGLSPSHLEDSDVPGVALHGLLKLAAFQTFLCSNTMQVLVEVQTWKHTQTHACDMA